MEISPLFNDLQHFPNGPFFTPALFLIPTVFLALTVAIVTFVIDYKWSFLYEAEEDEGRLKQILRYTPVFWAEPGQPYEFTSARIIYWHSVFWQGTVHHQDWA